jgi:hypothetical protein
MLSRYFGRKQNLPNLVDWMTNQVGNATCYSWVLVNSGVEVLFRVYLLLLALHCIVCPPRDARCLEPLLTFSLPPLSLSQYHKLVYAEDVLLLNEANRDRSEFLPGTQRLYGIAKPAGTLCSHDARVITQLLSFRAHVCEGCACILLNVACARIQ